MTHLISALALAAAAPFAAQAQSDQSQLTRPLGAADLNSHLARLASNPRDMSALIGAGEAALALDDPRAAAGFFARAEAVQGNNGRVKAGLGRVMLKLQNPVEALRQFNEAARLGYPEADLLSDRGLARDMTGDQAGAQRDYQAALARTPQDEELIRRYAASLGISGQVEAADKVLDPLLYKSDRAAWRYRAFIYAMNNRQTDARKVALQTMPEQLATAITPYMQKMPYLTAAQKAAAVHFGHFPQQVGTSIAAIVPTPPAPGIVVGSRPPAAAATTVAAATPQPKALTRAEQRRQAREAQRLASAQATRPVQPTTRPSQPQLAQAQSAQPSVPRAVQPTPAPARQSIPLATPAPATQAPAATPVTQSLPSAATPAPQPAPVRQAAASGSAPVQGPPAPGFETLSPAAAAPTPVQTAAALPPPPPSSVPLPNPEATRTLADIIRAIDVPETERETRVAAVNLDEIAALQAQRRAERQTAAKAAADKAKKEAAAKAKAEADAKAKAEAEEKKRLAANPSRNWLQVGVGQSKSALSFTMKRLRGKYSALAPQDAWSAGWGRTNRLLVGPFSSFTRARDLETKLKADGADVFAWKSDAGEVVEKLGGE
nr:SPOR domain-containing protein [Sphingobium amiense]